MTAKKAFHPYFPSSVPHLIHGALPSMATKKKPATARKQPQSAAARSTAPQGKTSAKKTAKAAKSTPQRGPSSLEKLRPELLALTAFFDPPIPVDRLLGEARLLASVSRSHRAALLKVGLDGQLVAGLPTRIEACAEAQSAYRFLLARKTRKKTLSAEVRGIALRTEILEAGRWALRNDEASLKFLKDVQEGEGVDDLIQDLLLLVPFLRVNKEAFMAISIDPLTLAQQAVALATELAEEDTRAAEEKGQGDAEAKAAKQLRDRASTHLVLAMREIRGAGEFAFRKDPAAQALFRGTYRAAITRRAKSKKKASVEAKKSGGGSPVLTGGNQGSGPQ